MLKKLTLFCFSVLLLTQACRSQEKSTKSDIDVTKIHPDSIKIYTPEEVDQEPEIVGGKRGLALTMEYPKPAWRNKISGEVVIKLVVLTSGRGVNHTIEKRAHPLLNEAAINTLKQTSFKPAVKDSQAVNCYFTIPLNYRMK